MEVLDSDIMDRVVAEMDAYDYDQYTAADVRAALSHEYRTLEDFKALLSPAAQPFIEEIAQAAQLETRKYFGNSVCMFTPTLHIKLLRKLLYLLWISTVTIKSTAQS
mgnify:CR=1 FL=1